MTNPTDAPVSPGIGDHLDAIARLTDEGHGAYLLLLAELWRSGPLPDDDAALAAIARLAPARWAALRDTLCGLFVVRDGRWRHARIAASSQRLRLEDKAPRERARAIARLRAFMRTARQALRQQRRGA